MILILDFGSQYTQLIARRVRELQVYSEVRPCTTSPSELDLSKVKGIILSGGPSSVTDNDAPKFDPAWFSVNLPIMGICYGMQLMAHHFGGSLGRGASREYGPSTITVEQGSGIFSSWSKGERLAVWMSHGDHVEQVPPGFTIVASSAGAPIAAMESASRKMVALQFHPEVVHTPEGKTMLRNFVCNVAGCANDWTPEGFIESSVKKIAVKKLPACFLVMK